MNTSSVTLQVVDPEVASSGDFFGSPLFDNILIGMEDNLASSMILGYEACRLIRLPVDLCTPDDNVVSMLAKTPKDASTFTRPITTDTRICWDIIDEERILGDPEFFPGKMFLSTMMKVGHFTTEMAFMKDSKAMVIEVPTGLIMPKPICAPPEFKPKRYTHKRLLGIGYRSLTNVVKLAAAACLALSVPTIVDGFDFVIEQCTVFI